MRWQRGSRDHTTRANGQCLLFTALSKLLWSDYLFTILPQPSIEVSLFVFQALYISVSLALCILVSSICVQLSTEV